MMIVLVVALFLFLAFATMILPDLVLIKWTRDYLIEEEKQPPVV